MDLSNRNLLLQYLELISEQQRIIYSLGTNITLINTRSSEIVLQYICRSSGLGQGESTAQPRTLLNSGSRRRRGARFPRSQRRNAMPFPRPPPISPYIPSSLSNIAEDARLPLPPRRLPEMPPQASPPAPPSSSPPPAPVESSTESIQTADSSSQLRRRRRYDRSGMYIGDGGARAALLPPLIPRVLAPPSFTSSLDMPAPMAQTTNDGSPRSTATITESATGTTTRSTSTSQDIGRPSALVAPNRPRLRRQRVTRFVDPMHVEQIPTMEELSSPVRIRPSRHQISEATELILYGDLSDNYHTICPIDQQDFNPRDYVLRIRHCGHIFREMNLRRHFRSSPRCPICRFDIRDYGSSEVDAITNQIVSSINQIFNSAADSVANRHLPGTTTEVTLTATIEDLSDNNLSVHLFGDE